MEECTGVLDFGLQVTCIAFTFHYLLPVSDSWWPRENYRISVFPPPFSSLHFLPLLESWMPYQCWKVTLERNYRWNLLSVECFKPFRREDHRLALLECTFLE